jgi:hypothetical protein
MPDLFQVVAVNNTSSKKLAYIDLQKFKILDSFHIGA